MSLEHKKTQAEIDKIKAEILGIKADTRNKNTIDKKMKLEMLLEIVKISATIIGAVIAVVATLKNLK